MENNELWALFWKCSAAVVAVFLVTIGGCTAHENTLRARLIAKSANPELMQCSLHMAGRGPSAFCMELARKAGEAK